MLKSKLNLIAKIFTIFALIVVKKYRLIFQNFFLMV
nr:MAG TPA: hypothetical protein [Caudoviricetes sp.]